jgi:hypothetical protein
MRRFGVPLLLLAMTVGVFWRLVLTKQYTFLDSPDMTNQVAPWIQVQAYAWQHGNFPLLWDPYVAGGQSLIGQAQPATAFPLNWLLFMMPLHHGFVSQQILHWYMMLVHFFAAWAAYALCRGLGRSRAASVLGASVYAFSGYVASTWWPQQVQSTIFAPLALLFSLRAIRGERPLRSTFFSGFFLGMMWLGGHHQVPIFTMLGIAGLWLFHIFRGKTARVKLDRAVLLATLMIAMIAAGALQMFPSYSYGHDSIRWAGASQGLDWTQAVPYSVHEENSQTPWVILGTFLNGFHRHANPFIGFTAVLLAIAALVLAWDDLQVRLLAFLALGAMIFSMGGSTILHSILYAVAPLVEKARSPAIAVVVFHLAICPLAAFGVDRILEDPRSDRVKIAAIVSATIGLLLFALTIHIQIDQAKVEWQIYTMPVTALAAVLLGVLLACLRSGKVETRHAAVWLIALVMLEIGNFSGLGFTNRDVGWKFWPALERDHQIAQFLKTRPGLFRVQLKDDDVPYSFGDWYGIETLMGSTASLMHDFTEVWGQDIARRLLGTRYYVAKAPAFAGQNEVMTGAGDIKVFEYADAMPRTWAVHEAIAASPASAPAKLGSIDPNRSTIVVENTPALETCDGDRVTVTAHRPQFAVIDASMNCRGMVILADEYSKDWVAEVDGKPAPIFKAYSFLRGVVVERGQHRIEFQYRPASVYWGAALTFASFAVALLLAFR